MIFRTESLSADTLGAPAATIVKAAAKAMAAAFASLFEKDPRRGDILTLSEYELRDIGLEHRWPENCAQGTPIVFDLLDLVPRGTFVSHRSRR